MKTWAYDKQMTEAWNERYYSLGINKSIEALRKPCSTSINHTDVKKKCSNCGHYYCSGCSMSSNCPNCGEVKTGIIPFGKRCECFACSQASFNDVAVSIGVDIPSWRMKV